MATVNIFNMADTWNNVATTYTAIKMNVTDTASASGSLLLDLQVGGSSKFKVSKTSQLLLGGAAGDTSYTDGIYATNWLSLGGTSNATQVQMRSGVFVFRSDVIVSWASDTNFGSQDLLLTRKAAANLRLGAADAASPVAQTLGVQSVVAGTTNTAGADFTIAGSQGTGTGAGGSIIFQVAPAGSSGTAQNALVTALTIDTTHVTFNRGGGSQVRASGEGFVAMSGVTAKIVVGPYGLRLVSDLALSWSSSTTNPNSPIDTYLLRDAANTLAQRNGTNAQAFNIYNTYTDASNYERGFVKWDTNVFQIGAEAAGSGTARNIALITNGGTLTLSRTLGGTWTFATTDGLFSFSLGGVERFRLESSLAKLHAPDIRLGDRSANSVVHIEDLQGETAIRTFTVRGQNAAATNTTNIVGGAFYLVGGAGASGSAGAANGGDVFIDGGQGYGTGVTGRLVIGATRATLTAFGGTTSSFPALKRSTTSLQARLADDSGFTNIQGKLTTETAYTAGAPTATGYIVLYDSTGTAYKVPAEAL